MRLSLPLLLALLPTLAAASEPDPDAPGDCPAPIVNGSLEDGFPAVVSLGADFGSPFSACTGTLITPRVVLTAAHCGADLPTSLIVAIGQAFIGPDLDHIEQQYGFVDYIGHPDYTPIPDNGQGAPTHDVGVGILDGVADVEPHWFNTRELTEDDEDTELFSVGFGITANGASDGGIKRSAEVLLTGLDDDFIISANNTNPNNANICSGDSGGPMFRQEEDGRWVIWGVHSWGDQTCTVRSGSSRPDLFTDWILDRVEDVHGTRDLCEINGKYDDGVCDAFCDVEDPDCVVDEGDDDDSAGGGVTGCQSGCSAGAAGGASWLALGLLPLIGRRRRASSLLAIGALSVALLVAPAAHAVKPELPPLTEDEMAKAIAGTVVLKKTTLGDGKSLVNAVVEFAAPPSKLWPLIFSVEHVKASTKSIKELTATRDETIGADRFLDMSYVLKVGWSEIAYSVNRHYTAADETMRWTLDKTKPADITWTEGSYSVYPGSAPGRTLFLYRARIETGKAIPAWLEEDLTESSLKKYLKYLKETAEQ